MRKQPNAPAEGDVRIRRVTPADLAVIKDIDRQSFGTGDQYDHAFYDSIAADPHWFAILVEDASGRVSGWALLNTGTGRLHSIAVAPGMRRLGYAQALVAAVLKKSEVSVELLVEPDNEDAIRLYRRMGFTFIENETELPGKLAMRKAR